MSKEGVYRLVIFPWSRPSLFELDEGSRKCAWAAEFPKRLSCLLLCGELGFAWDHDANHLTWRKLLDFQKYSKFGVREQAKQVPITVWCEVAQFSRNEGKRWKKSLTPENCRKRIATTKMASIYLPETRWCFVANGENGGKVETSRRCVSLCTDPSLDPPSTKFFEIMGQTCWHLQTKINAWQAFTGFPHES